MKVGSNFIKFRKPFSLVVVFAMIMQMLIGVYPAFAASLTAGPSNSSNITDNNGSGTEVWANPSRAQTSNDSWATTTITSSGNTTHYLKSVGYGFSIPGTATVNGIEVTVEKHQTCTTTCTGSQVTDNIVSLVKSNVVVGNNKASAVAWGTADSVSTYGSSVDLWGTTWTPTDVNNANFGSVFAAKRSTGGDRTLYVDQVTVKVYYTTLNSAPVAVTDIYSTNEDTTLSVPVKGVLANDTDADVTDVLSAIKVTDPSHGSVTLNSNGSFSYVPVLNYNGADSFTYKVNDGTADSNTATVNITVNAVNDAPIAVDDSYSVNKNATLSVPANGVLVNDTDVDSASLTAIKVTSPSHGVAIMESTGAFIYVPTSGYSGPDSFTYKSNDGLLDSNIATVSINVHAPLTITASSGTHGSITPTASVNYGEDKTFTMTPAAGYHVANVVVDGSSIGAVNDYTFTNVITTHTISVTYAINTYTITSTHGSNGTITGSANVNYGGSKLFTMTPNAGYHVESVLVDGHSVGVLPFYLFFNVKTTHTIDVTFDINSYSLVASHGANGTISPDGVTTKTYGSNLNYTITPDTGYHVENVWVDLHSVGAVNDYDFNNIKGAHVIYVTFAVNSHDASFVVDGVVVSTMSTEYGSDILAPEDNPTKIGYTFTSWSPENSVTMPELPAVMPDNDATYIAQWTHNTVNFIYVAGSGGTIDGANTNTQNIYYGGNTTAVTAVASAGYHFTGWSDGVTSATRNDLNVTTSRTVTANFAADVVTPLLITGEVLGDSDTITPPVTETEEKGEVKGTSDTKKDDTSNWYDASYLGVPWYGWLGGAAVAGGAGWWLFGAFRRRQDEE